MRARLLVFAACFSLLPALAFGQADAARDFDAGSARIDRGTAARPLTAPSNAGVADIVRGFVRARHSDATLQSLVTTKDHTGNSGVRHLEFAQEVAGLQVHGAYARASLSGRGELLSMIDQLVPVPALVPARVGPRDALAAVLSRYYPQAAVPAEESAEGNRSVFARTALFPDPPVVTRVAVPMRSGALHTGYRVETWDRNNLLRYTIVGGDGRILVEELRTNEDSYNIFPNKPDSSQPANGQVLMSGPGAPGTGSPSPIGWVSTNTTIGNNVDAYLDRDNNNAADSGGRPVAINGTSGSGAVFDYGAYSLTLDPELENNRRIAVANLFYLNNVLHDKLYRHGFTESAGNFQTDNFGKGGSGNDPVNAEAQDGGGTNNANFATPSDGSRPRMQMYLWTYSTPSRDGDVDSDIVYHEYGHGLTWRMIGGMSGPFAGAVGEGMSDTVAIYMNPEADPTVAEYSYNNPKGIRRYPYGTYPADMTYSDVKGSSVHADGEIYAATMWKLRTLWLAAGRTEDSLWTDVIDGMNYTPSRPAYEDMRDGILAAVDDQAGDCLVWKAFASRGIGEGANGVERCRVFTCSISITESFTVPSTCSGSSNQAPTVTIASPSDGAGFDQGVSIVFSGSATDFENGDVTSSLVWTSNLQGEIGTGGSFSRADLVAGTHIVTATATDGTLTGSSNVTFTITSTQTNITLSAGTPVKRGKQWKVSLSWSGASGSDVDVFRNGSKIVTTANDGEYTDSLSTSGTYTYKVCNAGTTTCSNDSTVTF